MGEDEFYDAVESTLDKMDEEDQFRERLRLRRNMPSRPPQQHPLWPDVSRARTGGRCGTDHSKLILAVVASGTLVLDY